MGLDITAYRQISKMSGIVFDADGEPIDAETRKYAEYDLLAYINDDFPGRNDGIENKTPYSAEDSFGFRAGSYGSYNRWRDELAKLSGWPLSSYEQYGKNWESYSASAWKVTSGSFWEIINFSDCEGVIGPETSKKLAADLAAFDDAAKASDYPNFYHIYSEFRKAFEMASDNGAVRFH
jgi:hypothetical protein